MQLNETNKTTKFKKTLLGINNNIWTLAIGTPENPMAEELSEEENSERRRSFEQDIRQMHLFYKMVGRCDADENSYLITNPNIKWLKYIFGPKKYNQESFLFGEVHKDTNIVLCTMFGQEDGDFVVWDTRTEHVDRKDADGNFFRFKDFKFKIPFPIFEKDIDFLSEKTDRLLSWREDYRDVLEESSKGMSNKTLHGIRTFNCHNVVSLEEHNRQLEQKDIGNRMIEDWISKYEHKVLEQERRIKEVMDSLENRR